MNRLSDLLKKTFPGPGKGARYRNEIRKLAPNKYVWRTTESSLPCATENFKLSNSCTGESDVVHRMEVGTDWSIKLYNVTGGDTASKVLPKLTVNGESVNWGDKLPQGRDLEMVIEGSTLPTESESLITDDTTVSTSAPLVHSESITALQSVEVIGEDTAVWKIKFHNPTRSLSDLFDAEAVKKALNEEGSINPPRSNMGNGGGSVPTGTHFSSGVNVCSSSAFSAFSGKMGSILSNLKGEKPVAGHSRAYASGSNSSSSGEFDAASSGSTSTSSSSSQPQPPGPTKIISTPFRLHHVLLGDFWLEFVPHTPNPGYGSVFFKCGYPDLGVKVNLQLLGPEGDSSSSESPEPSNFSKEFVSLGRASIKEDIDAGAYLSVNFNQADSWAGDGEIRVKAQLRELVKLPGKLRGVV